MIICLNFCQDFEPQQDASKEGNLVYIQETNCISKKRQYPTRTYLKQTVPRCRFDLGRVENVFSAENHQAYEFWTPEYVRTDGLQQRTQWDQPRDLKTVKNQFNTDQSKTIQKLQSPMYNHIKDQLKINGVLHFQHVQSSAATLQNHGKPGWLSRHTLWDIGTYKNEKIRVRALRPTGNL